MSSEQIDSIRQRVAELEREHVKSQVTVTLITEKVETLKALLREKYDVRTIQEAKDKLLKLKQQLQTEIDAINKIL